MELGSELRLIIIKFFTYMNNWQAIQKLWRI